MLIEYKDVTISQAGRAVISSADFRVDEGEFVYIIGKVGAGKSSLLKTAYCELGIECGEGGKAEVLGRDLESIKRKEIPALRRELGIIFQDFQLLHDRTVYKNLRFVLRATGWKDRDAIETRIGEVLEKVGMAHKRDSMPNELSGGEQQRVAIARALLNKPKVVIADEPTGNLDPATAADIVELLKEITKTGAAVAMSTHNIPLIGKYPGIVYRCADGRLEEATDEFNKQSGLE